MIGMHLSGSTSNLEGLVLAGIALAVFFAVPWFSTSRGSAVEEMEEQEEIEEIIE